MSLAKSSGWQWRENKIEEQNWRMMQLPNGSVGHGDDEERRTKRNGFDFRLDFKNTFSSRNELARP